MIVVAVVSLICVHYWLVTLVIFSNSIAIYLCMFVRTFSPLKSAGQPPDNSVYSQTAGVRTVLYFPVHGAGVINMLPHYNLSSAVKIHVHRQHRRLTAPATKTSDLKAIIIVLLRYVTSQTLIQTWLIGSGALM